MGERKDTEMILEVNLKCDRCYKRVKKVLCKFPQIRDQIFDKKSSTVTIKVFSCDPETIRYKLCNKGRGSIKSIEIKEPGQQQAPEKLLICCEECHCGRLGGPCNSRHGQGYYDAYYYVRMDYNWYGPPGGPNRWCHPCCCAEYFSEDNAAGCSVM